MEIKWLLPKCSVKTVVDDIGKVWYGIQLSVPWAIVPRELVSPAHYMWVPYISPINTPCLTHLFFVFPRTICQEFM